MWPRTDGNASTQFYAIHEYAIGASDTFESESLSRDLDIKTIIRHGTS